jgi:hypothetical protein
VASSEASPAFERISRPGGQLMSADAYRRHARRLRDRHAARPGELHRALRDLGQERDRHRAKEAARDRDPSIDTPPARAQTVTAHRRIVPDAPRSPADAAERFSAAVGAKLTAGLLCYSDRLALLRQAQRLGLDRFDANLLIAAAQHGQQPPVPAPPIPARRLILRVVAFIVVESAIGAAAWLVLFR